MRKQRPSPYGPTQKDIAAALGLAQTTVALALNPKYQHRYSADTVERIKQKAQEMGYRPQRHAQIMRGTASRVVGILAHIGFFESSRQKLDELIIAFRNQGYSAVVAEITWFDRKIETAINYLLDNSIEALVLLNISQRCDLNAITARGLPITFFNCNNQISTFPAVTEDIENAFYRITRHHIDLGSKRITFALNHRSTAPAENTHLGYTNEERLTGFIKAIHAAGGTVETNFAGYDITPLVKKTVAQTATGRKKIKGLTGFIHAPPLNPNWTNIFEVGRGNAAALLRGPRPPQSILCDNDDHAIGILRGCLDLGIDVPRQLRLSGYDASTISAYSAVPLTTYKANNTVLARRATETIIHQLKGGPPLPEGTNIKARGELLIRASTGGR